MLLLLRVWGLGLDAELLQELIGRYRAQKMLRDPVFFLRIFRVFRVLDSIHGLTVVEDANVLGL